MPSGTSIRRFSTSPSSVTITTSARPGDSGTNSICFKRAARSSGATTSPAQRDRPESADGRLLQRLPQALAGRGQAAVDAGALVLAEPAELQQAVDEEPQPGLGRQPPGRGMRREQQPRLLEIGHDVADGRRREVEAARRDSVREPTGSPVST